MAAYDRNSVQDFEFDRELRRLTRALTASIRDKKQKSEVAREYEDHIYDAMQHYMLGGMREEVAFRAACDDLGDIDEIAATLGDIHNQDKIPADVRREIVIKRTVFGIVFGALYILSKSPKCNLCIFSYNVLCFPAEIHAIIVVKRNYRKQDTV